jgi:hypothetical protein
MKRVILVLLAALAMFSLFITNTPQTVNAKSSPVHGRHRSLAPNSWIGGDDIQIDLEKYPTPGGMQMVARGVKVTEPGEICHNFRGGQFYWVAEIYQLTKDGEWVNIPSTAGWYPTVEGKFRVCASAKEIGTYAMFAHYSPPE